MQTHPCVSSLQLVVGFPAVVLAVISGATLISTNVIFVQVVRLHVSDGVTCPKYALSDFNQGSWQAMRAVTSTPCRNVVIAIERFGLPLSSVNTGVQLTGGYQNEVKLLAEERL